MVTGAFLLVNIVGYSHLIGRLIRWLLATTLTNRKTVGALSLSLRGMFVKTSIILTKDSSSPTDERQTFASSVQLCRRN